MIFLTHSNDIMNSNSLPFYILYIHFPNATKRWYNIFFMIWMSLTLNHLRNLIEAKIAELCGYFLCWDLSDIMRILIIMSALPQSSNTQSGSWESYQWGFTKYFDIACQVFRKCPTGVENSIHWTKFCTGILLVTPCLLTRIREFIHTQHRNTTRGRRPSVVLRC